MSDNVLDLFGLAPNKLPCPGCGKYFETTGFQNHRDACDRSGYCTCAPPIPGWWGLECSACRRLIPGAVDRARRAL